MQFLQKKVKSRAQWFAKHIPAAFQSISEKLKKFLVHWSAKSNVPLLQRKEQEKRLYNKDA